MSNYQVTSVLLKTTFHDNIYAFLYAPQAYTGLTHRKKRIGLKCVRRRFALLF
jgi:hypothetical protein